MDQNLLTLFVAATAVAVVIQTGILAGFYFLSVKLTRQADQAADRAIQTTRSILGPVEATAANLKTVTARFAELTEAAQKEMRRIENWRARRHTA